MSTVTTAEQPAPRVEVLPPEEALRRARPLPRREDIVLTDLPDQDWDAFQQALAEG